jgi:hypothetical protein
VTHHYWAHLQTIKQIGSALLATVLWPLILLGINLHITHFHHPFLQLRRSHACRRSSRPRDAQSRAWGRSSRRLCAPLATIRNPAPLVTTRASAI